MKFKRCILKLTGEAFSDPSALDKIANEIKQSYHPKLELAIVLGGGNFFRGRNAALRDKLVTDRAGMLGTVINGILLENILKPFAAHLSALDIKGFVTYYQIEKALEYLQLKKILILSGGTGLPHFTTDTATALRACELNADLILKATNVDGVYSTDPNRDPAAKLIKKISYKETINKNLKIMDQQAFALLQDRKIPLLVFNIFKHGNLKKALAGRQIGSMVC
ncbi:MAG: uridine monophosphate kinase [Candidatus Latescibacteria bacterium]|nr:uridine monophosphate kinase [Candidatus Latescibacterota bacterium]